MSKFKREQKNLALLKSFAIHLCNLANNFCVLADILPKKVGETLPAQSTQVGYGIYPYYQHAQPPYLVSQQTPQSESNPSSNEHANGKQTTPQSVPTSMPAANIPDYSKVKEPPSVSIFCFFFFHALMQSE